MSERTTEWERWIRVGPRVQRNLVIEAEGLRMVRYRIAPGHSVRLHTHRGAQIGVILSGGGVHRFVLEIEKNGRVRRVTTELTVHAGDCYYIPPNTPHGFDSDPRRPVVAIDIMIGPPPRSSSAAAGRSSEHQIRSAGDGRRRRSP